VDRLGDKLEQLPKLIKSQPCVANNPRHSDGVDRIVSGHRNDALTIAHDHVLTLPHDPETDLLQRAHSRLVRDAR